MQPLTTKLWVSLARQQIVPPMLKTGSIQMKLRDHPTNGDVASSALSTGMEKDSWSAESRRLTRAGVFHSDWRLVQARPPDAPAHRTLKSQQRSHFYRCPGCSEMVDGRQLSEVLIHHQHVLDAYRLTTLRGFQTARARPGDAEPALSATPVS
jgi:hypothetical protein